MYGVCTLYFYISITREEHRRTHYVYTVCMYITFSHLHVPSIKSHKSRLQSKYILYTRNNVPQTSTVNDHGNHSKKVLPFPTTDPRRKTHLSSNCSRRWKASSFPRESVGTSNGRRRNRRACQFFSIFFFFFFFFRSAIKRCLVRRSVAFDAERARRLKPISVGSTGAVDLYSRVVVIAQSTEHESIPLPEGSHGGCWVRRWTKWVRKERREGRKEEERKREEERRREKDRARFGRSLRETFPGVWVK